MLYYKNKNNRKVLAIKYTFFLFKYNSLYIDYLNTFEKKDDICDCLLYILSYIKKKFNDIDLLNTIKNDFQEKHFQHWNFYLNRPINITNIRVEAAADIGNYINVKNYTNTLPLIDTFIRFN